MRWDAEVPADARQREAADPALTFWLSANAGSGKTRVLIARVARMLHGGTPPQRILCLTYTKAAATEMQNRLFDLLGEWAMKPDAELVKAMRKLGIETSADADELARARRLFAQAIETPGGLRIQTIHSFCATLLRRFPLEAAVAPGFREMDEAKTAELRALVLEELARSDRASTLETLGASLGDDGVMKLIEEICKLGPEFRTGWSDDDLRRTVGLAPGITKETALAEALGADGADVIAAALPFLEAGSTRDKELAAKLGAAIVTAPDATTLDRLFDAVLRVEKDEWFVKTTGRPTKDTSAKMGPALVEGLADLAERVLAARHVCNELDAVKRAGQLRDFAQAYLPLYEAAKAEQGLLDFDDLIVKSFDLLSNPSVAQWVLYRLDGGLDHILVDEAQDTSPLQWRVIERLTEEMTAGLGGRERARTLFVVGDKKQSIYSFQGADLAEFDRMRQRLTDRMSPQLNWNEGELSHSFRSATAILTLVDLVFTEAQHRALGGQIAHIAFNEDRPGRVDLWAPEPKSEKPKPEDYFAPTFLRAEPDENDRLARRIAREIRAIIDRKTRITQRDGVVRPVHEGDFLILVRRRTKLTDLILRACKAEGLAVAGADRMELTSDRAVRDIVAFLSFLALPEDDLSLATALRSPLFGWSEEELFDLAARRPEGAHLWQALREARDRHAGTLEVIDDMLDKADFLRPHDLIDRALTRWQMREKLIGRLGSEAEEGIDELLTQALSYETADIPSLTGFLIRLDSIGAEARRRFDAGSRAIRIMTVHGAKGLEAPIVILPETAKSTTNAVRQPLILTEPGKPPLFRVARGMAPPAVRERMDELVRRNEEERLRLLYVALTRPESWLIVAAAGDTGTGAESWYGLVEDAMKRAGAETPTDTDEPWVMRLQNKAWPEPDAAPDALPAAAPGAPPAWLTAPSVPPVTPPRPGTPSGLPGAKALPGEAGVPEDVAKLRGTRLHLLLETLPLWPEAEWPGIAEALIASGPDAATSAETVSVLAEATAVLRSPEMTPFLGKGSLSEVTVSGPVPDLGGQLFIGAIDRLVVGPDRVVALDYKSNAVVPDRPEDVPEGILRQMGIYAALLQQTYPGRAVETAIFWTSAGRLMPLPPEIVRSALLSTPIP